VVTVTSKSREKRSESNEVRKEGSIIEKREEGARVEKESSKTK
jgi:hypothetical protein